MIAGRKVHDTAGNNLMKIKGNIYDWILMILIASLAVFLLIHLSSNSIQAVLY